MLLHNPEEILHLGHKLHVDYFGTAEKLLKMRLALSLEALEINEFVVAVVVVVWDNCVKMVHQVHCFAMSE
jgi:hypothetical protein